MAKSVLGSLLPLMFLFLAIVVALAVGFVVYSIVTDVADKTSKKMEKHNVLFSPDGMKIGVKGKSAEEVGDSTQSVLMSVWNNSSWPEYKSKLGWGQKQSEGSGAAQRQPYSRSTSSQQGTKKS